MWRFLRCVRALALDGTELTVVVVASVRVDDKRTGVGNSVIRATETYSGRWKDGEFHGGGVHCDARGNVYDGEVCVCRFVRVRMQYHYLRVGLALH